MKCDVTKPTAPPNRSVLQTDGPQMVDNFVTSFLPGGGPDEALQTVSDYIVTVDAPGIFAVLPDISNDGTLTFTPAIDRSGIAIVSVQARDTGGQLNGGVDTSAIQTFTITVTAVPDTTPPTVTLLLIPGGIGQSIREVEILFSEVVTGFEPSDLIVQGGVAGDLLRSRDNTVFNVLITPTNDGALRVDLPTARVKDLAGNDNVAGSSDTITVDATRPTPVLAGKPSTNNGTFDIDIEFNESVTGLTINDFQVNNAVLSNLLGNGNKYTAILTATNSGVLTITLPEERVVDAAFNFNLDSNTLILNTATTPTFDVVTLHALQIDPPDLGSTQPTSWARQRSMLADLRLTFDSPRTSISASDVGLTNLGVNAPVDADVVITLSDDQIALRSDGLTATIAFAPGQITDGVYRLELLPSITGGAPVVITGDATNKFFVLRGDWNGSGSVTSGDFATFAYWFGNGLPAAPGYVDNNASGSITAFDFAGYAGNFGKSITFPTPATQAVTAAEPENVSQPEGELFSNVQLIQKGAVLERRQTTLTSAVTEPAGNTLTTPRRSQVIATNRDATSNSLSTVIKAEVTNPQTLDSTVAKLDATLASVWDWLDE